MVSVAAPKKPWRPTSIALFETSSRSVSQKECAYASRQAGRLQRDGKGQIERKILSSRVGYMSRKKYRHISERTA